jgi:N-formylglutamate amidohydrolase
MPDLEKALNDYAIDEYYGKAFDLVLSGKARDAFDLNREPDSVRDRYGRTTFGHQICADELASGSEWKSGNRLMGYARGKLRTA